MQSRKKEANVAAHPGSLVSHGDEAGASLQISSTSGMVRNIYIVTLNPQPLTRNPILEAWKWTINGVKVYLISTSPYLEFRV